MGWLIETDNTESYKDDSDSKVLCLKNQSR